MAEQKTNIKKLDTENTDEQQFIQKYYIINFAKMAKLIYKDLKSTQEGTALLSQYKKQDIIQYIQTPAKSEKILRQISNLLYNLSPHYKRLLNYFSNMARYDYVVDLCKKSVLEKEKSNILKDYVGICDYINTMNIKHEFSKITKVIFREDIFYGYEYQEENSYTIQRLDPDFCRISGQADGVYTFEFDFSFFRGRNKKLLNNYAPEFREKYEIFENDSKKRWQELSEDRSICIKLNEDLVYPIPFFVGVFADVLDIQDYKVLKKSREELQNYVILVATIPRNEKSDKANDFLLTLDTAIEFGNKAMNSLPDQVGFILSPYQKVEPIYFNKTQVEENSVAQAESAFWNATGVNNIFNAQRINEEVVRKAVVSDETIIFSLYRQYERWVNRKLKLHNKGSYKIKILNTTEFNYREVYKQYKEAASYGVPIKRELTASLGVTPSEMIYSLHLENEILDLAEKFEPLLSSNTLSPDKKDRGRPTKQDNIDEGKVDDDKADTGDDNED